MSAGTLEKLIDKVDAIADVIRDAAPESEHLGYLAPDVVAALHEADLFRMLVPETLGGLGLTIPESIAILERVAALDSSTGWALAILADGAIFARRVSPEAFTTICGDPRGLVAGTLNPVTARARVVDGGFLFSGRATYLSGSAHARWILAAAIVFDGDEPVITDDGIQIRSAIFPIERARDLGTWNVTGMRATGSNDYEFDDVEVAADWTFEPMRPQTGGTDIFSWIPLWAQLGPALTACAVGAARNMIERFTELATVKVPTGNFSVLAERAPAQIALGEAQGLYQAARAVLMETAHSSWDRGVAHEPFDNAALARSRLGLVTAVQLSARAIDLLHDASGMNAVARDTVLDRCWRDVHTMTQHVVLSPARFEIAGRVLLGLDPGAPII
ncbi:MAG: indole-3-acetate monooxygenase [Actinomycetota bacterium]|jgi:alkylation response protein AidB-like acyl-CoA dehydrogenase|nr:indole-3-acetate monooxygenase [Actinomycetota bacterium]